MIVEFGAPCQKRGSWAKRLLDGCFGIPTAAFLRSPEQEPLTRLYAVTISLDRSMPHYSIAAAFKGDVTLALLKYVSLNNTSV